MNNIYRIADLNICLDCTYERVLRQAKPYLLPNTEGISPDFTVKASPEGMTFYKNKFPHISDDDLEYMLTGSDFYNKLLHRNGIMLHSSAIVLDGKAYLFSANPGTGKSTHTQLWIKKFGEDRAYILNDDKPAIRLGDDGIFYAYGTPWSGKYDMSTNTKVPLQGIAFLERGVKNSIQKMDMAKVIKAFMEQTLRPKTEPSVKELLSILDQLLSKIAVHKLACNMDLEAVSVSYEGMSK